MLHSTDPKKLKQKEVTSKDILISHRMWNKIVIRGRWREVTGWEREWIGSFKIRCGEEYERWPNDHENEWKSAPTERGGEVRDI